MTFRGIVKNGVVVFENGAALPDGTTVRVQPERKQAAKTASRGAPTRRKPRAPRKRSSRAEEVREALAATFGIWKDRPEWRGMTTLEIQADLRRKAMGLRGG